MGCEFPTISINELYKWQTQHHADQKQQKQVGTKFQIESATLFQIVVRMSRCDVTILIVALETNEMA
jgi:hypothetical protein